MRGIVAVFVGLVLLFCPVACWPFMDEESCDPEAAGVAVDPGVLPVSEVAGFSGEQLVNAAFIMSAAASLGLSVRDQQIGVMTAIGESGLVVLDHGDAAGADSRGLFQQRDNGAWGSLEDRMDPFVSATNFFKALMRVDDRGLLMPSVVAWSVQRNSDRDYYAQFWDDAVEVVSALSGFDVSLLSSGVQDSGCGVGSAAGLPDGVVTVSGWSAPVGDTAVITSGFGARWGEFHDAIDLAMPGGDAATCGQPIWAVADGVVSVAGPATGYGQWVIIDHASGVQSRYGHMWDTDVFVAVGDQVKAGQVIGKIGSNGRSTGCHLDLGILVDGATVDPVGVLGQAGIHYGVA